MCLLLRPDHGAVRCCQIRSCTGLVTLQSSITRLRSAIRTHLNQPMAAYTATDHRTCTSHAVLPADWFPDWAVHTNQKYIRDYGDPLVSRLERACREARACLGGQCNPCCWRQSGRVCMKCSGMVHTAHSCCWPGRCGTCRPGSSAWCGWRWRCSCPSSSWGRTPSCCGATGSARPRCSTASTSPPPWCAAAACSVLSTLRITAAGRLAASPVDLQCTLPSCTATGSVSGCPYSRVPQVRQRSSRGTCNACWSVC